jgi:hypothetical protein
MIAYRATTIHRISAAQAAAGGARSIIIRIIQGR